MDTASAAVIAMGSGLPATHRAFICPGKFGFRGVRGRSVVAASPDKGAADGGCGSNGRKLDISNSKYVVRLDKAMPGLTRPLAEILRDLNKRVSDKIVDPVNNSIPWYHANRMMSFYAPGWCGEVREVIFSATGNVTVVYRVTVRGSDGEAHRESTGMVHSKDNNRFDDAVAAAEELAFGRACARFGFGLHLYHEDGVDKP